AVCERRVAWWRAGSGARGCTGSGGQVAGAIGGEVRRSVPGPRRFDEAEDRDDASLQVHEIRARIRAPAADLARVADRQIAASDDRDGTTARRLVGARAADRPHRLDQSV